MLNSRDSGAACAGIGIQIVTATAMLEDKVPPESFTTFCPGLCDILMDRQFKCWVYGKSSHGVVGLHKAILEVLRHFFL